MTPASTSPDHSAISPWRQDFLQIDGLSVRYHMSGQGSHVLLLHGWGGAIESLTPVLNDLQRAHTVYAFDLPGFGESSSPPSAWGSAEYAQLTLKVMDRLNLDRPHLIGHSFGGQVSLRLAAACPERVGKLVLVGSAGIRTRPRLATRLKRWAARLGKWFAVHGGAIGERLREEIYRRVRSQDYADAGPLRATLVKVLNEDLTALLPQIKSPTLLVWGEQDRDVPLAAARVMVRSIAGAQLVVFENAGHFAYLDHFDRFRLLVGRFLREPDRPGESTSV
ncbi:MAG TPA: alpha/beta fold hydrolase [Candidatus Tectomicrobia bacterium]|nr:alpha/beta fold hydrolase [Candidatus Tectomicrobia bacterium]